ncbi:hypothetical protein H7X46_07965 [Pseudonocardia sp. C8]|uniref:hypothetical protein n=1 Tax=Pseudonocardia sp. C8 TaxID=2762759 RepID=UPI0016424198|nr:hypothetical protein [Pseudonocardia sp. C8]MBC3190995.1 hypothetical protein [Pseudonocardia sp. C8]
MGLGDFFQSVGKMFGFGPHVVHGTREPTGTSAVPFHTTAPGTTPAGGDTRDTDGMLTPIPTTGPSPFGSPPTESFAATTVGNAALGAEPFAPTGDRDDPMPDRLLEGHGARVPEFPNGVAEVERPDWRVPDGPDGEEGRIDWYGPGRDIVEPAGPDPGRGAGTAQDGSVFQRETNQHDTSTGTASDDGGGQTAASSEANDASLFSAADFEDTSVGGHEAQFRSSSGEPTDQQDWPEHTDPTG